MRETKANSLCQILNASSDICEVKWEGEHQGSFTRDFFVINGGSILTEHTVRGICKSQDTSSLKEQSECQKGTNKVTMMLI